MYMPALVNLRLTNKRITLLSLGSPESYGIYTTDLVFYDDVAHGNNCNWNIHNLLRILPGCECAYSAGYVYFKSTYL